MSWEPGPVLPPEPPLRASLFGVQFTAEARWTLRLALAHADGCELLFRGTYDHDARRITAVELLAHGAERTVCARAGLFREGDFHIHSHPSHDARPSEEDLKGADVLAVTGVGMAVVNRDASRLHVVIPPARPRPPQERRTRTWQFGRFLLIRT